MSFGHNCRFRSSQCNIREITEILMNILASFFVQSLFCALNFYFGSFHQKFDEIFFKLCYFVGIILNKFTQPFTKTAAFQFFSCKNRICHHKFELNARNNDWTNKRSQDIHQNLCDFPNITLAGSELAIVAKRHLVGSPKVLTFCQLK
jgi:hypothetical protein